MKTTVYSIVFLLVALPLLAVPMKSIRDSQGRVLGMSRKERGQTKVFDRYGRLKGSSTKVPGGYRYKDKLGRPAGFSELDGMFNGFLNGR